jgi:UDP-N-acetylmuramoylalanine--D-glutamate ligase
MIPVTTFSGKRVALFGLGGSGLATAEALVAGGADVVAWDDNPDSVEKARAKNITAEDLRNADWSRFAAFVLSPGARGRRVRHRR